MKFNRTNEFIFISAIVLIILVLLSFRTYHLTYENPSFNSNWDHHQYIQMAQENPFSNHTAPFGWRILDPLLAKLLPFEISVNFAILNFLALWATGVFSYFLFKQVGFSGKLAITGTLFFLSLGWAAKFTLYDFWLTDPLSFLFIVAALWSILAKNDLLFLLLLLVGVTAKENVVFVAPLYYTLNTRRFWDGSLLFKTILLTAPALIALIALRLLIPANNSYDLINLWNNFGLLRIKYLDIEALINYSLGTFGFSIVFLPFFAASKNIRYYLRFLPFIVLTYCSLLFAGNNERILVAAFPAVIIMALFGLDNIARQSGFVEKILFFLPLSSILLLLLKVDWFSLPLVYEAIIFICFLIAAFQSQTLVS